MGQVCPKHNEFYETECRWCEPAVLPVVKVVVEPWRVYGGTGLGPAASVAAGRIHFPGAWAQAVIAENVTKHNVLLALCLADGDGK